MDKSATGEKQSLHLAEEPRAVVISGNGEKQSLHLHKELRKLGHIVAISSRTDVSKNLPSMEIIFIIIN